MDREDKEVLIKKIRNLNAEDFAKHDYEFLKKINPGDESPTLLDQINEWKNEGARIDTFKEIMEEIIENF